MKENDSTITRYREVQLETSTTLDLVDMAYDGIVTSLKQALEAIESDPKSYDSCNEQLAKAQQIVAALDDGLDENQGELSSLLSNFYSFIRTKLIQSNMEKAPNDIREILDLVEQVRGFWQQAGVGDDTGETDIGPSSSSAPPPKVDITG